MSLGERVLVIVTTKWLAGRSSPDFPPREGRVTRMWEDPWTLLRHQLCRQRLLEARTLPRHSCKLTDRSVDFRGQALHPASLLGGAGVSPSQT